MNNRLGLLGIVLLVQLVIIAAFLISGADDESSTNKLLDFDPAAVDRVVIADQEATVELSRKDGSWWIGDLPIDADKADKLVNDFASFASPWPVSTTASSTGRFELTAEKFQRRLTFYGGTSTLGDVWLGTSPGFQRVHARREGSDAVYSIAFSNLQAPVKAEEWLDKAILAADGAVKAIVSPAGFKLEKGAEGWLIDGVAADQDKATGFADRFENLRVIGVADLSSQGADKGTFTVTDGKGEYTLQMKEGGSESEYVVISSRQQGGFKLAAYVVDQLLAGREGLMPQSAESGTAPAAGAPGVAPENDPLGQAAPTPAGQPALPAAEE